MTPQEKKTGRGSEIAYDPAVALQFFKSAGTPEAVAQGAKLFAERERALPLIRPSRMYLLLEGEVELLAGKKPIGRVKAGEIFGELAVIASAPRSATAVATTACRVIALDDKKFHAALEEEPGFALMLMSVMIRRLRETIPALSAAEGLEEEDAWKEAVVFDTRTLGELVGGLTDDPPVHYLRGSPIMAKGQKGLRMYAVLEGRVAVSIDGRTVEKLGPGGVFGEAALVSEAPRLASAVAETDCSLQPINRDAFLALVKLSPKFADTMLTSLAERLRYLTARLD